MSSQDVASTDQSRGDPGHPLVFSCAQCSQVFPLQKTLSRHMQTVHQSNQDRPFSCGLCSRKFKRKDILYRHEAHQHNGRPTQECSVCGKRVRPRALAAHVQSLACREVKVQHEKQTNLVYFQNMRHRRIAFHYYILGAGSVPDYLPAIFDILFASAWLVAKLQPWGKGEASSDLWLLRSVEKTPSIEVLELQGLIYRSVMRIQDYDPRRDSNLIDAIMLYQIVLQMVDGSDVAVIGIRGIVSLEHHAMMTLGKERNYPDVLLGDIFTTVLSRVMPTSKAQVPMCRTLLSMGLQLVRDSAQHEIQMAGAIEPDMSRFRTDEWARRYQDRLMVCAHLAGEMPTNESITERSLTLVDDTGAGFLLSSPATSHHASFAFHPAPGSA